jgi:uncharacterized protein (TIGR02246 family)
MRRSLALVALLSSFVLPVQAQEKSGDPMAGYKPPKVKNEAADRKEILALFKAMDEAGKKGDLEAAAALVDFPVLMITDDSKGQAHGESWEREQWTKVMEPFYAKPMTDMKVTHKPTIVVVSDSLASVTDAWTMTMGKQKMAGKSATLLIRRDGTWRVKSMMEGGWGDAMAEGAAATGSQSMGTPSTGAQPTEAPTTERQPTEAPPGGARPAETPPGGARPTETPPTGTQPTETPPTGTQR